MANKRDRKMNEQELQALLHMRHREKTHTPKKGKGSFSRNAIKQNDRRGKDF